MNLTVFGRHLRAAHGESLLLHEPSLPLRWTIMGKGHVPTTSAKLKLEWRLFQ